VASNENPQPANAAEALERLGRLSLRELSMDSLLQTVAELAKTVMPGNPEASVTLLVRDKPSTVVSTGSSPWIWTRRSTNGATGRPCMPPAPAS
jgi:hypothetical protein